MFDLIFQGASAINQAMLLGVALSCMGIGALLLANEIHWRLRALRVMGIVIGVRETEPNLYRTVYQYSPPGGGETVEATSNAGSNSTSGRETGRRVELLVFAERPERVTEARWALSAIYGAFFFLLGFWPMHAALRASPVTWLTWVMLVGGIALIAFRTRALFIPKANRKSMAEWRSELSVARRAELAAIPVRTIEDVLASPEVVERRRLREKASRNSRPLLLLAGAGVIVFAVYLGHRMAHLEQAGLRAPGTVVSLHEERGSDSSTYYPIVSFIAENGEPAEFRDRTGSNPPSYQVGEKVTVLYEDAAPADSATIDRGKWNWLPAAALGAFGCFLVFVSLRLRISGAGARSHLTEQV